jgi:hypothetical protein
LVWGFPSFPCTFSAVVGFNSEVPEQKEFPGKYEQLVIGADALPHDSPLQVLHACFIETL